MPDTHAAEALPGTQDFSVENAPSATTTSATATPHAAGRKPRFVPSEAWYALPPILMILGLWLGLQITHGTMAVGEGVRLEVPGQTTFTVDSAGNYVLWDEYRTIWNGRTIDAPAMLKALDASALEPGRLPDEVSATAAPGTAPVAMAMAYDRAFVTIHKLPEDVPVPQRPVLHSRENAPGTVRVTLGRYKLPAAGEYRLHVWGDFPGRVFQLRKDYGFRYYAGFLCGLGISLAGGLGGPALFLWVYLRRRRVVTSGQLPEASSGLITDR